MTAPSLTRRESEILPLLAGGLQAEAIGDRLHIEVATVRRHLGNLYRKLGAPNGPAAVHQAHLHGLLQGEGLTAQQRLALVRSLLADPEVAAALVAEGVNPRAEEYSPTPPDNDEHYCVGNRWPGAKP